MANKAFVYSDAPLERLQEVLRVRTSDVLFCAHDILSLFPASLRFSRADVIACLYKVHHPRTIDRALWLLEAHGICVCVRDPVGGKYGGALYRVAPAARWHEYDPNIPVRRKLRYPSRGRRPRRESDAAARRGGSKVWGSCEARL